VKNPKRGKVCPPPKKRMDEDTKFMHKRLMRGTKGLRNSPDYSVGNTPHERMGHPSHKRKEKLSLGERGGQEWEKLDDRGKRG